MSTYEKSYQNTLWVESIFIVICWYINIINRVKIVSDKKVLKLSDRKYQLKTLLRDFISKLNMWYYIYHHHKYLYFIQSNAYKLHSWFENIFLRKYFYRDKLSFLQGHYTQCFNSSLALVDNSSSFNTLFTVWLHLVLL